MLRWRGEQGGGEGKREEKEGEVCMHNDHRERRGLSMLTLRGSIQVHTAHGEGTECLISGHIEKKMQKEA